MVSTGILFGTISSVMVRKKGCGTMSGYTSYDYHFGHLGQDYVLRWISCGKSGCSKCPHGPYFYQATIKFGKQRMKYHGKFVDGIGSASDYARLLWSSGRHTPPSSWLVARGLVTKTKLRSVHDRSDRERAEGGKHDDMPAASVSSGYRSAGLSDRLEAQYRPVSGTVLAVKIRGISVYDWIQKEIDAPGDRYGRGCEICHFGDAVTAFAASTLSPYRDSGYAAPAHLASVAGHLVCRGCLLEARRTAYSLMQVMPGYSPTRQVKITACKNELKVWNKVVRLVYPR